jgi:hypothetical protein
VGTAIQGQERAFYDNVHAVIIRYALRTAWNNRRYNGRVGKILHGLYRTPAAMRQMMPGSESGSVTVRNYATEAPK